MSQALREVIDDMQASPVVPSNIVDEAKTVMQSLYDNLLAVAKEASRVAVSSSAQASTTSTRGLKRSSSSP
eukprot:3989672-Karenia_brevis.AAC.1